MSNTQDLKQPTLALSSACLNKMRLGDDLEALHEAGLDELVFFIGDGVTAPFMASLELAHQISVHSPIACNGVLFAQHPERHIAAFASAGCKGATIFLEGCVHTHRVLGQIKELGMEAGIALNPATPLTSLDYLLGVADHVCLLGVEVGDTIHHASQALTERTRLLAENIRYRELAVGIDVYGGLDLDGAVAAVKQGARRIIVEPPLLAKNENTSTAAAFHALRTALSAALAPA